MSTSRRQTVAPLVVEIRPDYAKPPSSQIAPSSPPSSPKAVRFATEDKSSRPLTSKEAWSLYHFECHARRCHDCYDPYEVYRRGRQLCTEGHSLAQDVAIHVYYKAGDVFGQNDKLVRVELPRGYEQVRSLLKGMAHDLNNRRRTVPVVTYDKTYPVKERSPPASEHEGRQSDVTIEPARSDRKPRRAASSSGKSKRKSSGYKTVVIDDNVEVSSQPSSTTASTTASHKEDDRRRGSLYQQDQERRRREAYRIEVREPSERTKESSDRKERRRREERKSGFYP